MLVAARQLRTALFAREIRKIPHTEASSPAYILGYMRYDESIEPSRDLVDLRRGIVLRQWIMPQLHHPAPIAQRDVDHPQVEIELWSAYQKQQSM